MLSKIFSAFDATSCSVAVDGVGVPARIMAIHGIYYGDADCYVQLHDRTAANDDVPTWGQFVYMDVPFEFRFPQGIQLSTTKPLPIVAYSSTNEVMTRVTGEGNVGDLFVEVDQYGESLPEGYLTAGDLTSAVKSLEVWADSAGPKRLMQVDVKNNYTGADVYAFVYAYSAGAQRIVAAKTVPEGGALTTMNFGRDGLYVRGQTAAGTLIKGCSIYISTTNQTTGFTQPETDEAVIRAYYQGL